MESVVRRACNYANPEIARLAAGEKADLYVAHQHHALPAAAGAASRAGSRFGFDAEDLLADSTAEPRNLIRSIEQRYLPGCAYVSTMSEPAARRLHATNRLNAPIAVLHNTPSIKERGALDPPDRRRQSGTPSIYWFGQTLGPHSCAEQLLRALPLLERPVRVVLRGAAHGGYVQHLERIAAELDVSGQLKILPIAPPGRMVELASEHDILLGSQPGEEMFHQLAVGNKVFTGMMAGLALALTDTIAHRHLLGQAPGCGFPFPDRDEKRLAEELNSLLAQPARLAAMKQRSWECAQREFNWEVQARRYLSLVEGAIAGACV